jgi:hypothetical protein
MSLSEAANQNEELNAHDWDAAKRALLQNWPGLKPSDPQHDAILEGLAHMHQYFGQKAFELHYNLRLPNSRLEEWQRDFFQRKITQEEYRNRLKSDAERPIDLEMLRSFHDAYPKCFE